MATFPTFHAAGTVVFTANNVQNPTTLSPLRPTRSDGDLLLCFTWSRSITATVATPTGWTLLTGFPLRSATVSGGSLYVFAQVVDGTDTDPSVVWTGLTTGTTLGDSSGAVICSYTGCDVSQGAASVLDGTVTKSDQAASTTTVTIPSVTTTLRNSLAVGHALKILDSAMTWTPPTGWNEEVDTSTTSGTGHGAEISELRFAAAGATGAVTCAPSVTTASQALGCTLALKGMRQKPSPGVDSGFGN
jgi:hypothetical protein